MQKGISITELAARLEAIASTHHDYLVPAKEIGVSDDVNSITIPKPVNGGIEYETLGLNQHSHRQLSSYLGIPADYYDRQKAAHPETLAASITEWLNDKSDEARLIRTNDRGVRAILSNSYRILDNFEIAIAAINAIMNTHGDIGLRVVSSQVTDAHLHIQAVTPRVEGEVKVGDRVQAGFALRNSEIGLGAASIQRLIFRLLCLNGLIVPDGKFTARHLGRKQQVEDFYAEDTKRSEDHTFLLQLRDNVLDAVNPERFEEFTARAGLLTDRRIEGDPVKVVEKVTEVIGANVSEQAAILRNLIAGGDTSAWGVVNAVTAVAHTTDDYDRSVELEAAGGQLIALPANDWGRVLQAA